MRICRYSDDVGARWGVVDRQDVYVLDGSPFDEHGVGTRVGTLDEVELLAPCEPSKVVCAGRNYRSLLAEQGRDVPAEPFLFLKASTAVVGPGATVYRPRGVEDFVFEGELAVVIGRKTSAVTREEASHAVLGYTVANDMTVRDWQAPTAQWLRAKSSDTHCPLGPWIETDLDAADVGVRTLVGDDLRQDGRTSDLVFGVAELIASISAHMTLLPGDAVLTGTSAGVGPVAPGDVVRVEIEGIGTLENPIAEWPR